VGSIEVSAFGTWRTFESRLVTSGFEDKPTALVAFDNHGALTICLHAAGKPASVSSGFGLDGGGCNVDSLNQKSSS
jgi:hypothetical protein